MASSAYPDDGHIFVCVRVRDVPESPCLSLSSTTTTAHANGGQQRRTTVLKEAQRICVSTLENVVVMHDPRSLDDASVVARDANNVVQLLTDRANGPVTRPSTRKSTGAGKKGGSNTHRPLLSTQTASYYECDECITSMDESSMLRMPMIKGSDFLQPPAYGSQEDVYRATAMHAVAAAVEGINSCVFAYGQTGSGKTYTLFGDTANIRRDPGIVPRTLDDLFSQLDAIKAAHGMNAETEYSFSVSLSFFEIYNNEVFCLFSRRGPLHVQFMRDPSGKKETMVISDLQQQVVTSSQKAYPLIEMGLRRRQTGETGMNARSSRSHAILQVRVTQWRTNRETRETVEHNATINLVDLAGSERQKTANTQGKSRDDGIHINQSLATLARVINDISQGAKFVNYRDSLLTMVLKDNLGGNSKTFMIATVSPIAFSYQESCATLTYAKDVRRIRNRPVVNRTFQTKASLLEQNARLKTENERLKEQMDEWMRRWNGAPGAGLTNRADASLDSTPGTRLGPNGTLESLSVTPLARGGHQGEGEDATTASMMMGHEAFIAATSATGLTAPLVISSHRKYTSIAGIGGSCVEGGVIRVTSLVSETVHLRLASVLRQGAVPDVTDDGDKGEARETPATPPAPSEGASDTPTASDHHTESREEGAASALATAADDDNDLGYLEFERTGQRSCEQRFYMRIVLPTAGAAGRAIADVHVNGRSIGSDNRHEMHHGDVVCVYLEDTVEDGRRAGSEQSLLVFHYVDLSCLSRAAASANHATLGQIAVSIDLPGEMEGLTIGDIQQLQRDRDKLLDLVQRQKQTIEFQCQQQKSNRGFSLVSSVSQSPEGRDLASPEPYGLRRSPSAAATPAATQKVALETFRRTTVSPTIRARSSMLPADVEDEELLRRAREQSQSQSRLDNAVSENKQLHRAVTSRNATLEALARRLAELEAGGSPSAPRKSKRDGSSEGASSEDARGLPGNASPAPCGDEEDTGSQSSPLAVGGGTSQLAFVPSVSRSLTRVSISSSDSDQPEGEKGDDVQHAEKTAGSAEESDPDGCGAAVSVVPSLRARAAVATAEAEEEKEPTEQTCVFFESAEGARERYKAAVREGKLHDRITELEGLIADLRAQLALLGSRLRVSKDDTLEQEMLRGQAEFERDALLRELTALRAEAAELSRDNEHLEVFLKRSEEALAAALTMGEEESMKKAKAMAGQIRALRALALLWKRRAMRYIAMGYGEGAGELRLEQIPWDELRYGATAKVVKEQLGSSNTEEGANAIDEFERTTAVESVLALEAALQDLEAENRRLQDLIKKHELTLKDLKDLIDRLKRERDDLEREMQSNAAMDEEERQRLQRLLDRTNKDLAEAESNSRAVQKQLQDTVAQSTDNARKTSKKHDQLLAEQRQKLAEMEGKVNELKGGLVAKDDELRTILRYVENNEIIGIDGAVRDMELRTRIEDLIHEAMNGHDAPTGYSVFPADFLFSDELIALIRVCLRILLDRLKIELYVLNKQNLHKFSLLVPTVQLRPEAQFHVFMHELRGVASEVAGRPQRTGGKWTLTEADVLSDLVDHRRRRAGGALYGLLIWYDHWDLSPKLEHVSYMELIRNADRIMQMARQVRQESLLNTNATSTLLMPIPSRSGKSESTFIPDSSRKMDKTVSDSRRILSKLSEESRRSNLASALNEAVTPCKGDDGNHNSNKPFSRSATALALSQNMAFSRTSSTLPYVNMTPAKEAHKETGGTAPAGASPSKPPRQTGGSHAPPPLPPGAHASSGAAASLPQAPTPAEAMMAALTPQKQQLQHRAYSRVASTGVLPVTDNDVAFVAGTDVEQASSINRFNYERRMSTSDLLGNTLSAINHRATAVAGKGESYSRKGSTRFSRCQTAIPTVGGGGAPRKAAGGARASTGGGPHAAPNKRPTSASLYSGYELPKAKKGSRPSKSLAAPGAGDGSGLSPKPRTPAGVASLTRKNPTAAAPAPTSFYSPSIIEALRQRSESESNRPSTAAAKTLAAVKGEQPGSRKLKPTPSSRSNLAGAKQVGSHGKGKPHPSGTPFEATRTATTTRFSAGGDVPAMAGRTSTPLEKTDAEALTPVVPPLDLSQLSR